MRREGGRKTLVELIRAKGRTEGLPVRTVRYEKGNTLYDQGEPAYWICFIVNGLVDLVKRTSGGKRFILDRFGPGEFLGVEALANERLPSLARHFTAEAVAPTTALLLEPAGLWMLLQDEEVAQAVVQALCRALQEREWRISTLLACGAPDRIRETLAYLHGRLNGCTQVLTHAEIAMFTGLTEETVCKNQGKRKIAIS